MREARPEELIELLKNNFDYVLELSILQEPQLCRKPVYKFERAFMCGGKFCLIYSEADDPEIIAASYNSRGFGRIIGKYNPCKIVFHGASCKNGEFYRSFYYNKREPEHAKHLKNSNCRLLTGGDKNLLQPQNGDDYLNILFGDFIEKKIWSDCGIIGAFDGRGGSGNFAGYLAYCEIAENIRDVSYIYVKDGFRRQGYAKKLLEYFKNKNIQENKMSYYSYAADEASANLAESCGFLPCAERYEIIIC